MRSFFLCLLAALVSGFAQPTNIVVESGAFHAGTKSVSSFPQSARKANGPRFERSFESQSNPVEWTLRLKQQNVADNWEVEINGRPIARLNVANSERLAHFSVPPGALVDGTNTLAIIPRGLTNDILVSSIEIIPERMRDFLKLAHVEIQVTEMNGRVPVPARVTIVDKENRHAELYNVQPSTTAWRKGIFYTGSKPVELDLPQGEYTITATRGMEWSRSQRKVRFFIGQKTQLTLALARELDTSGYVAADMHVHSYTFSGHGDASIDDRIYTLAGEGIELPIATDHNHFTDYAPREAELDQSQYFTPVIGDEVTTANGHFNAFPFHPEGKIPDYKETNWVKLVAGMRDKGAHYVILNHPRWPSLTNSPFAIWGLNRADGSLTNTSVALTMDAIELQNAASPARHNDPNFMLRDWFALLNHGEHLWAVGGSDSHTIAEPIGQSRTYIASADENPGAIDIAAVVKAMKAGNMSVSYGIFGGATVDGRVMGQIARPIQGALNVSFHVGCPDWIKATNAVVYLNGLKVAEQELSMAPRTALRTNVTFQIPAPKHDAYLICVAYGDGVKDPSWKTVADYTLAVTNPIFIDADADGKYSSPRETAVTLLKTIEPLDTQGLEKAVAQVDPTIGVQMMSEARSKLNFEKWEHLLETLSATNEFYSAYRSPAPLK